ncbi:hypothetical protein ES319_D11G079200v1 [Gossypium barbadense]|uniref:Uncharacterized protein n=2 Tax=Gossypium TaxID=3633 RepID=A0A5J5P828_GOSBA|nr:hypothetical protein ES319_D11G079200v1 [Gossypium barbadense]TYG44236.1 hypothetical protein ES288_D11G081800v1 [Gossypium darwinii]
MPTGTSKKVQKPISSYLLLLEVFGKEMVRRKVWRNRNLANRNIKSWPHSGQNFWIQRRSLSNKRLSWRK